MTDTILTAFSIFASGTTGVWYSNDGGGYSPILCVDCALGQLPTPDSDIEFIEMTNTPCSNCGDYPDDCGGLYGDQA